jgi:hypothetical protein
VIAPPTSRGYRYIGTFHGAIRTLPLEQGRRVRMVISTRLGGDSRIVQLAELRENGLHRLASSTLAVGLSGTAEAEEGNRLLDELMNASVVSPETIRKVFGLDR